MASAPDVFCPNPACGRPSRLGSDALGRTFRCGRCGTKLPRLDDPSVRESSPGAYPKPIPRPVVRPLDVEETPRPSDGHEPRRVGRLRSPGLGVAHPTRVGRYLVRGRLGSGSCATVYRALDPDLEREVALKVPHPGTLAGPKAVARFLGEARAMARLRHPGIVAIYEAGRAGETPYLATAFVAGSTLAARLDLGPLDPRRAAEVAAALADALAYAHGSGVVHRDVKPANVLVDTSGAVFLTDFGLAHRHGSARLTREGVLVGTPAYVAPEQAASEGGGARPESDQYSLGVVLYEMLCGRTPFEGPPPMVLYKARHDAPPPPRRLRPGVPAGLERICLKAMARDPSDRYASCLALSAELRAWLEADGEVPQGHAAAARASWWGRRLRVSVAAALGAF